MITLIAALSSGDTVATVQVAPVLDTVSELLTIGIKAAIAVVVFMLPPTLAPLVSAWHLDQIVADAASAALMNAKEVLKNQLGPNGEINIDVKNVAVANAIEMVLGSTSPWIIMLGGGKSAVRTKAAAWVEKIVTSTATSYMEKIVPPVVPPATSSLNLPGLPPAPAA
jgi:hypothetical protein